MNILKKLALVVSLSLAGLTAANAAGTFVPMDSGDPGDFQNSWTVNSGVLGELGAKGTIVGDYFQFNIPDDEYVSFSVDSSTVTFKPTSSSGFLGYDLYSLGLDSALLDEKAGVTLHSIEGGTYLLTSGEYELDIFGEYTKKNGTYDLAIFGTPVPEPENLALMLAGLGAMGLLARRRKQA